jgi:signal transduction histidine kinase
LSRKRSAFFAPELQDREIVVEQELRSDLPLLQLDRDQMKQAFYNVIKNSVEAMNRHGTLRIRTDLADTHVLVRFIDTGGGMSAENLSRVFEPYFTTESIRQWLGLLLYAASCASTAASFPSRAARAEVLS